MLIAQRPSSTSPFPVYAAARSLPRWLLDRFAHTTSNTIRTVPCGDGSMGMHVRETKDLLLASVIVPKATALSGLRLQQLTVQAYDAIHETLSAGPTWYPIRIWNWIPDIHALMGGGVDRYMVFNAGRFASYYTCYQRGEKFETAVATATGVGHDGADLVIQVLGAPAPGTPVENPRQIRSYRYSDKFGPMPPCFARATLSPEAPQDDRRLLIGGTASVCGESSVHIGDVHAQSAETLKNLAHLIAEASRVQGEPQHGETDVATELRRIESMRVFFVKPEDAEPIAKILWPFVDHLKPSHLEFVRTDICRRELLVEIEGTARIAR